MPVPFDPRQIRSYVIRAGRMTPGQSNALETQWQHYGLEPGSLPITPQSLFSTEAPLVLEIGFGMGDSLFEMLQQQPDRNFIGVEVHKPGVGHLLHLAAEAKVENLRVYCADSVEVLRHCLPNASCTYLDSPALKGRRDDNSQYVKAVSRAMPAAINSAIGACMPA